MGANDGARTKGDVDDAPPCILEVIRLLLLPPEGHDTELPVDPLEPAVAVNADPTDAPVIKGNWLMHDGANCLCSHDPSHQPCLHLHLQAITLWVKHPSPYKI